MSEEYGPIMSVVVQFMEEDEWPFSKMEDKPILRTGFRGDNGNWRCYAQVQEDMQRFIFYSVLDTNVPEEKRQAMAEFLTRANYGLIIGNFEMDFRDGEIRYKSSIDVEGGSLTPIMVKQMVYANVLTMDRYLPGIMQVIYGGQDPEAAIAAIEG